MRRCQSLSSTVCIGRRSPVPALFTRMSTWPSVCATLSTALGDLVAVAYVECVRVTADLGDHLHRGLAVAVEHDDRRPFGCEATRGRGADTGSAAGDDRHSVFEIRHGGESTASRTDRDYSAVRSPRRGRTPRSFRRPSCCTARTVPTRPRARRRPRGGTRAVLRSPSGLRARRGGRVRAVRSAVCAASGSSQIPAPSKSHTAASGVSPEGPTRRTAAQFASTASAASLGDAGRAQLDCAAEVEQVAICAQCARPQHAVGDVEEDRVLVTVQAREPAQMPLFPQGVDAEHERERRRQHAQRAHVGRERRARRR